MLAHGAVRLWARLLRAPAAAVRFAHGPRGRGYAPLPRTPTRGKLSLQAVFFARCARPAALRAGFLCWRMQPPARVRACGALPPQPFAALTAPEGRGYAPLPRTPTRGKLSLQAVFCALRARVRFAQVFFVLAHAATRPCARSRRSLGSQHGVIGSVRAVAARLGDIDPLC